MKNGLLFIVAIAILFIVALAEPPWIIKRDVYIDGQLTIDSIIKPSKDNAYDLGTPTLRFRDIYCRNIYGGGGTSSKADSLLNAGAYRPGNYFLRCDTTDTMKFGNYEKIYFFPNDSTAVDIYLGNINLSSTLWDTLKSDTNSYQRKGIITKDGIPFLHDFHPKWAYVYPGWRPVIGHNVFLGDSAGNLTTTAIPSGVNQASYNVGIGYKALCSNQLGTRNIAIGSEALGSNTDGINNIAIGWEAGMYGSEIGDTNRVGVENIFIGNQTQPQYANDYNEIVIGHAAKGNGSNTATYGNANIKGHYFTTGKVQINDTLIVNSNDAGIIVNSSSGGIKTISNNAGTPTGIIIDNSGVRGVARIAWEGGPVYELGTILGARGNNYPMRFTTSDTERVRITKDGKIGIGTPVPSAKLQINGGSHDSVQIDTLGNITSSKSIKIKTDKDSVGISVHKISVFSDSICGKVNFNDQQMQRLFIPGLDTTDIAILTAENNPAILADSIKGDTLIIRTYTLDTVHQFVPYRYTGKVNYLILRK